jgi:23S rRNA pseudouridine1911/1915/1917 synthase
MKQTVKSNSNPEAATAPLTPAIGTECSDYSPSGAQAQADVPAENQAPDRQLARVPVQWAGLRLDKALVSLFPAYTRARLQEWLEGGRITIDGKTGTKASYKLKGLEAVVVEPEAPAHMQALVPEPLEFDTAHEDERCIVVNKPTNLVVHPAAGHWSGTLMNGLLHRYPELIDVPRAGIVHRLDKDTTGLMVVARDVGTQQRLIREMAARRIRRIYLALVWGRMTQRRTVEAPIGRDSRNRQKMAVVSHGKPAMTHFYPLATGRLADLPVTLLACKLETGRTHQIRVHATHAGFGLVGDSSYRQRGARPVELTRQALHACYLAFLPQGSKGWEVQTVAPVPGDLATLLEQAGIPVPDEEALMGLPQHWEELPMAQDDSWDEDFDDDDYDVEIIQMRGDEE